MVTREEIVKDFANEKYDEVIDKIKIFLKKYPNEFDLQTKLVLALSCNKNFVEADIMIKEIVENHPPNPYLEYVKAKRYYDEGEIKTTIFLLENSLKLYERNISRECLFLYYELLALTYRYSRDIEKFLEYSSLAVSIADIETSKLNIYSNYLFYSNYLPELSKENLYERHLKYNEFFTKTKRFKHNKKKNKKIKIGYISPDFRMHVVIFFVYQLLSKYNKEKFIVTCYCKNKHDFLTTELKNMVDNWIDIENMSHDEAATQIYNDDIDILFDLSGHTANSCLPILARKPAPIQISGIGYFNTTGLKEVDYFLTDINCDPYYCNDDAFVEKLIRLNHSHFCYVAPDNMPQLSRKDNNFIVFGSFNNFNKINKDVLALWKNILDRVEGSKLVLKSPNFDLNYLDEEFYEECLSIGLKEQQIELRAASKDYLKEYNEIDIALDTWPYPGGGTTCDALYMGVPVITLVGERHGSRFGYSILKNIGLVEGIAFSKEEYVEKAVALAQNKERLSMLHLSLRQMMENSPLMDGKLYMTVLEEQYQKIWQQYLERENDVIMNNAIEEKYYHNLYLYISKDKDLDCERILMQAFCLLKLKQYEQAETLIEKVVAIDPLYFDAYLLLAEIYIDQGKEVEEQEIISTVLTWFENKGLTVLDSKEMKQYQEFKDRLKI